MIDRKKFFDEVRESLFNGVLTQRQVDAMNYLLDVWEKHFADNDFRWLAYALATVFHETAFTMEPIEEYGRGSGKPYGEAVGPHHESYFGRGYPQLTWEENYVKGEANLKERYGLVVPLHEYPHRMLEHEPSALVLYDGMIYGWFTGAELGLFFNISKEDPYNARTVINGHDKADVIEGYY